MPPRKPEPHPVEVEVAQLKVLLEWARREGFRLGPELTVGSISVKVADLRLAKREGLRGPEPEMSILSEHGFPMEDDE